MNRGTTAWVLLRGLTRDARHWGAFLPAFSAAVPGQRVVAIDLPGNGLRHRERSPMTVAAMAIAARHSALQQGVAPPYGLLAVSLGGMVACAWAQRWPEEVSAQVLINTSLRPWAPLHERLRPEAWSDLLCLALAPGSEHDAERRILARTSARPERQAAVLADWTRWRRTHPVSRANALRQLLAAARYQAPATPAAAALILASLGDRLVDPACSQRLAAAWGAPLRMHPTAGHDLSLDEPQWVVAQLRCWGRPRGQAARP